MSLLDNKTKLIEYINENLAPTKDDRHTRGEVFTPLEFINNNMLKSLEKYYKKTYGINIWSCPNKKWFDPAAGMGNFQIALYYKLMNGLKKVIPKKKDRKKYILEEMLFMAELNNKNCYIINDLIFNVSKEYKLNLYNGNAFDVDFSKTKELKKLKNDKENIIIIGNPPWNKEMMTKKGSGSPFYNEFIEAFIDKCSILSFVIPNRWFSCGKGLDSFRENMLNRNDLVEIKTFDDASEIFGNIIEVKGGINHFIKDSNYKGKCRFNNKLINLNSYDILFNSKFYSLVNLVTDKILETEYSLKDICIGQSYSGITSNDSRLVESNEEDYIKNKNNYTKCYVSLQKSNDRTLYILKSYLNTRYDKNKNKYIKRNTVRNFKMWKVFTPRSAHGSNSGFSNNFIIGRPGEVCNQSYIVFEVKTKKHATNLISYLETKFVNLMLSIRKLSQDISPNTCKWIPMVSLDEKWNDDKINKYLNFNDELIELINNSKINNFIK
jgi:hypothetical protein